MTAARELLPTFSSAIELNNFLFLLAVVSPSTLSVASDSAADGSKESFNENQNVNRFTND